MSSNHYQIYGSSLEESAPAHFIPCIPDDHQWVFFEWDPVMSSKKLDLTRSGAQFQQQAPKLTETVTTSSPDCSFSANSSDQESSLLYEDAIYEEEERAHLLSHVKVRDGTGFKTVLGSQQMPAGHKYAFFIHVLAGSLIKIGVSRQLNQQFDTAFCDNDDGWAMYNGELRHGSNNSGSQYGQSVKAGDIVGVLLDSSNGTLSFSINGQHQGVAFDDPELKQGTFYPAVAAIYKNDQFSILHPTRED